MPPSLFAVPGVPDEIIRQPPHEFGTFIGCQDRGGTGFVPTAFWRVRKPFGSRLCQDDSNEKEKAPARQNASRGHLRRGNCTVRFRVSDTSSGT